MDYFAKYETKDLITMYETLAELKDLLSLDFHKDSHKMLYRAISGFLHEKAGRQIISITEEMQIDFIQSLNAYMAERLVEYVTKSLLFETISHAQRGEEECQIM